MIIDDDLNHLASTRDILELEGYKVHTHHLPFGATHAAGETQPDLILLDINMPGLSGEILSTLLGGNRRTFRIPVVFYSSNDEDSLRQSVVRHGVLGYICKGDVSALKRRVKMYLAGDAGGGGTSGFSNPVMQPG